MVKTLFPDFLTDPNEYQQAEMLWRARWDELVLRVGQTRVWATPWLKTAFANGTPFADGNPIFSAISPDRRLGVRVIQVEPSDDPGELSVWTDTFAQGEPEEIKELVISCALNTQTLDESLAVIERWITKEEVGEAEHGVCGSPADANGSNAVPRVP